MGDPAIFFGNYDRRREINFLNDLVRLNEEQPHCSKRATASNRSAPTSICLKNSGTTRKSFMLPRVARYSRLVESNATPLDQSFYGHANENLWI